MGRDNEQKKRHKVGLGRQTSEVCTHMRIKLVNESYEVTPSS